MKIHENSLYNNTQPRKLIAKNRNSNNSNTGSLGAYNSHNPVDIFQAKYKENSAS